MNEDVRVRFGAETGELDSDVKGLNSEFTQLFETIRAEAKATSETISREMNEARDSMRRTTQEGSSMGGMFDGIKGKLVGLAAGIGLTQIARDTVSTITEFERLRAVLVTLEGDASETRFADLKKFAAETPFDLAQVVTAFSKLKAQGLDPSNAALKSYGNTAAGMGKSLDQMVEAVSDAAMGEMERLKEFGIKAQQHGDKVTFIFKGVATTVKRDSQSIQDYIQKIGNTDFGGGMERQAATMGGAFSNLGDAVASFQDQIGQGGLAKALAEVTREFTDQVSGGTDLANTLGEVLGQAVTTVWDIIQGFGDAFGQIFAAITDVMMIFTGTTTNSADMWSNAFKGALAMINGFGVGVRVILATVGYVIRTLAGTFVSFADVVNKAMHFDFAGSVAAFNNWRGNVQAGVKETAANIVRALAEGKAKQDAIFAPKTTKAKVELPEYVAPKAISMGNTKSGADAAAKKAAAEAKRAAKENLQIELDALGEQIDAAKDNFEEQMRLEDQKLARLKEFYGADSREYQRELINKRKMQEAHDQEMVKLAQQAIERKAQIAQIEEGADDEVRNTQLAAEASMLQGRLDLGEINAEQMAALKATNLQQQLDQEREHEERIYQLKLQAFRDELALQNLKPEEARRINNELEQLEAEHAAKLRTLDASSRAATQAADQQAVLTARQALADKYAPIEQGFTNMINGMLTRTTSFKQGMIAMADQWVTSWVAGQIKTLFMHLMTENAKTAATSTGVAIRTSVEAAGAATSKAISLGSAISQIAHKAAVAAAGAYAAIASIPVVGPFLAPVAAAAALYGVYKLASGMFSAREGWGEVPYDGAQTTLHKKEMVLPAKYASPLRDMLTGPRQSNLASMAGTVGADMRNMVANSGSSDSYAFHYQPKHENNNTSLEQLLQNESRTMEKWFQNKVRNGALKVK